MNHDYAMSEISLDGFQLVRGQLFARTPEPSMSIWYSSISFNAACHQALNDCASIQFLVHSERRRIIIKPCPSKDQDAVNWQKASGKHKSQKIECSKFMHQVFELWGLDKDYHYRATGQLVMADRKVMLLFDFSEPEAWQGMKMINTLNTIHK